MDPTVQSPAGSGVFDLNAIDRHFSTFIGRLAGDDPHMQLAAALVSYYRSLGHICLDLERLAADPASEPLPQELDRASLPEVSTWIKRLKECPAVGKPGDFAPLILDEQNRLYLHRYWKYETDLAKAIKQWARADPGPVDWERLGQSLTRLFPQSKNGELDWQMVAAFVAARKRLCIISGGPGTGKTRTVVVLLALLIEQAGDHNLRIALTAPTGKAAARLQESVRNAKDSLLCSREIKDKLPEEATTIHRLLRSIPDSAYFQHDVDNQLPVDVVVVDEASMVDLALMAKLTAAIPASARLILLGDKDQLSSVEAGAVLADICNKNGRRMFSTEFGSEYAKVTGKQLPPETTGVGGSELEDCIVELQKNYRFGDESSIYRLSHAVNEGNADLVVSILQKAHASAGADVSSKRLPQPSELKGVLKDIVLENFAGYLKAGDPANALQELGKFRVLCALRRGPYGVENLNELVEELLTDVGLIREGGNFYAGRPIMITRNDYNLKLFNGDIGILLSDSASGELRAYFSAPEGGVRCFLPLRLPAHHTAFALTVHKSQGSEFGNVLLILPCDDSQILTRELVYTGLTRAREKVELWYDERILTSMVNRKVARSSGLRDALWKRVTSDATTFITKTNGSKV